LRGLSSSWGGNNILAKLEGANMLITCSQDPVACPCLEPGDYSKQSHPIPSSDYILSNFDK